MHHGVMERHHSHGCGQLTLSYDALTNATSFGKIIFSGSIKEHFLNLIEYLLLTDEEYKKMNENEGTKNYDQWLNNALFYHSISRKEVIPFFCFELLKFRTKK
jgi:hypothetical protein